MWYTAHYPSPLGDILMAADEKGLTGLWFNGQKYYAAKLAPEHRAGNLPALEEARRWLETYFAGHKPDFTLPLHMIGTAFQIAVWSLLLEIPYGKTLTYGEIAARLAAKRGLPKMSAQAVGGAVGHNGISVVIPCHRVVGANGSLTGYAGAVSKKLSLLKLEGADTDALFVPKKGSAL